MRAPRLFVDSADIARMQAGASAAGTEVLAASLRGPQDVVELAEHGITAWTASPDVLAQMLASDATTAAHHAFESAAALVGGD